jgi:small subunit ribosomal protein S16
LTSRGRDGAFNGFSSESFQKPAINMALKIRLSRIGATHQPIYHVVVAEARSRRDGAAVETLGTFSPRAKKDAFTLDLARAEYWLSKGALPTDTAKGLIKKARKAAIVEAPAAAETPAVVGMPAIEIPVIEPSAPASAPAGTPAA